MMLPLTHAVSLTITSLMMAMNCRIFYFSSLMVKARTLKTFLAGKLILLHLTVLSPTTGGRLNARIRERLKTTGSQSKLSNKQFY